MSGTAFKTASLFLISALCSLPVAANSAVADDVVRKEISTVHFSAGRPSVSRPAAGELPQALRIEVSDDGPVSTGGVDPAIETRAAVAATWTAQQKVKYNGRREIYRAGFHDGLKMAMADPLLGQWDHSEGIRAGRRDSEAGRAHGTTVHEPRIVEVFDQYPLRSALEIRVEPLPDPWQLYRSENYSDFYDHSWTDPESAFDYWLDHHRDRAVWRQLDPAERSQLERLFKQMFRRQLKESALAVSERAYGQGFDDGWDYGSLVAQEWSYRQGYHEGFEAVREVARAAGP